MHCGPQHPGTPLAEGYAMVSYGNGDLVNLSPFVLMQSCPGTPLQECLRSTCDKV